MPRKTRSKATKASKVAKNGNLLELHLLNSPVKAGLFFGYKITPRFRGVI